MLDPEFGGGLLKFGSCLGVGTNGGVVGLFPRGGVEPTGR